MCQIRSYIKVCICRQYLILKGSCMAGEKSASWDPAGRSHMSTYLKMYFAIIRYTKSVIILSALNLL